MPGLACFAVQGWRGRARALQAGAVGGDERQQQRRQLRRAERRRDARDERVVHEQQRQPRARPSRAERAPLHLHIGFLGFQGLGLLGVEVRKLCLCQSDRVSTLCQGVSG